jgi:predicted DNA-binding WGR domain protein
MSSVTLRRTDAAKNMLRYYRLDVQQDLFGQWCCVREWGRIGAAGQMRSEPKSAGVICQCGDVA